MCDVGSRDMITKDEKAFVSSLIEKLPVVLGM